MRMNHNHPTRQKNTKSQDRPNKEIPERPNASNVELGQTNIERPYPLCAGPPWPLIAASHRKAVRPEIRAHKAATAGDCQKMFSAPSQYQSSDHPGRVRLERKTSLRLPSCGAPIKMGTD